MRNFVVEKYFGKKHWKFLTPENETKKSFISFFLVTPILMDIQYYGYEC